MLAGMEGFETFLFNTSVLYNLLVVYAFVQALVLILMLCFCATAHQAGSAWAAALRESMCSTKQLKLPQCSLLILGDAAGELLEVQEL